MSMIEVWDAFPINVAEMMGPIERRPFTFGYSRFEVWQAGQCIDSAPSAGVIKARLTGPTLNVEIDDPRVQKHISRSFSFGEISTNGSRKMWSKDILNRLGMSTVEYCVPDISSLFYRNGKLSKVTFTIHDPNTLVEFYQ